MATKIKLSAHWTSSEEITERMIKQFSDGCDLNDIEFVFDDSYDVVVFFNHVTGSIENSARAMLFANEPTWNGIHQKNTSGIPNLTYYCIDKSVCTGDNLIETSSRCFYGGRGPWCDTLDVWSYKNLKDTQFSKGKNISSILTTWNSVTHGPECLYEKRYKLAKHLIEHTPFIDFFGGWGNSGNLKPSPLKIDCLADYKFNLVSENQHIKNWITEKFYDCVLTDTIPIYYGCANIEELWPEGGYIQLPSLNPPEVMDILKYIEGNADALYEEYIPRLRAVKRRYLEEESLLKFLLKEVNKDG